jgi:hypothetical protein
MAKVKMLISLSPLDEAWCIAWFLVVYKLSRGYGAERGSLTKVWFS